MRPESLFPAFVPITSLKGCGPRLAPLVEKLAGGRVLDLWWHLPSGLIDRRYRPSIAEAEPGRIATITLTIDRHLPPRNPRLPYKIIGHDGSGRLTLVFFNGRELTTLEEAAMQQVRWKGISMIFQGAMNALNPVRTVGDQIAEAIIRHEPDCPRNELRERVDKLLDLVGISAQRRDHYPHQYSGGMRQRAMIAMALACNPQVVIADEPTTALDVMIQAQILELLANLSRKLGLSVIFVTHDLGVVAEMCDRVLVMYGGMTAEYAGVDAIYNQPLHPYTQELLKAFPDLSHPGERLASIPGVPPRLDALPPGCRFAPRCPAAFERCRQELPAFHQPLPQHIVSCHLVEGANFASAQT